MSLSQNLFTMSGDFKRKPALRNPLEQSTNKWKTTTNRNTHTSKSESSESPKPHSIKCDTIKAARNRRNRCFGLKHRFAWAQANIIYVFPDVILVIVIQLPHVSFEVVGSDYHLYAIQATSVRLCPTGSIFSQ